jgi:hypothetical protein
VIYYRRFDASVLDRIAHLVAGRHAFAGPLSRRVVIGSSRFEVAFPDASQVAQQQGRFVTGQVDRDVHCVVRLGH